MSSIYRDLSRFTKREITELFRSSRRTPFSSWWDIRFASSDIQNGKLLCIINKKVGNAPTRNKLKRQLKAIFYEEKLFLYNITLICIVKPPLAFIEFNIMKQKFLEVFHAYIKVHCS